jgi:hypothetical protein
LTPADAAAKLEEGYGCNCNWGTVVASAGDVNGDGYADVIVNGDGEALVYRGSASGIVGTHTSTAMARLSPGGSVASAGDVNGDGYDDVIVGAGGFDAGETDEGAAFVYHGGPLGIVDGDPTTAGAQLESNQAGSSLGFNVAGAGDVNGDGYADVIVGAPSYDAGLADEGAAFVFHGSGNGIASGSPTTADTQLEGDQLDANMGQSVAAAGDVNGDGYDDVIVAAYRYDAGQTDEGVAFVFHGSASGVASGGAGTAGAQLETDQAGALCVSAAGAGDVDGDGYADVIVAALSYDAGETDEGAAFVFHGSASGVASGGPASADAQLETDQGSARVNDVAGAGDINGDGYADVIVGSARYDDGQLDEGAAFVFHGSASGIIAAGDPASADAQLESDLADARLGNSVSGAGDVNGDGYADVIVGARLYDSLSASGGGAAFVFHGSASGIASGNPASADAQLKGNQASAWMGESVAGAGDVNGDGYDDVIVGAVRYDAGETDEGAAFVFLGTPNGIAGSGPSDAEAQLESDQASAFMGDGLAGAGDVNGDGFADVIVGATYYDAGETDEGAAFLFYGGGGADNDGDGVLDTIEAGGPNGGDANGDGIVDSAQPEVASIPEPGGANYIALEVSGGCSTILDVVALSEDQIAALDPTYDYPHGLVEFEAPCETATIDLWFHGATSLSAPYRKYGPTTPGVPATTAWYTLPGAVFGTDVIDGNTVATVTLSLADNALGDDTGDDGTIVDIGGPIAVPEPGAMLGLGSCLAGLFLLNRRRQRREH